jgi:Tol biopolymer transport system component
MNGDTRIERQLPQILSDLGAGPSPDYTDTILARTAATRQRPGLVFPERWVPMSALTQRMAAAPRISWRTVAVLALLVLALVSAALYVGSQQRRLPVPFGPADNGLIPYVANGDLFLGDPVTGESRLFVSGPEADALPQFSPDGTRVAFIRDVGSTVIKPIDIYVARDDGSGETKITPEPIWNWQFIAWTPDGQGVAVVSKVDAATNKVDVYDATGGRPPETILSAAQLDFIEFRPPDGSEIMFRARVDGSYGLFGMDADGSNVHPILLSSDPENQDFWGGAAYTPDGSRIFYTRPYVRETADGSTCCSLWVMNADGSDPHQFIPNEGTAWDGQPAVSPDGSMVAFWHVNGSAQVAVAPADAAGQFVTTGPALPQTSHWVWAPDSSKILMWSDDEESTNAYLLDPAGGDWDMVPWRSDPDIDWQRVAAD